MNTPINNLQSRFKQVLLYAPGMLGNDAVNFFLDSFKRQAWLGSRLEPWAKRRNNKRRPGRAILVDTGRLRRSIRITKVSQGNVTIGTDVPYAKAHNEGFRGTVQVKAHKRNKYTKSRVGTGKLTKTGKERTKTISTVSGSSMVKAHTRKVNIVQRRFMGTSPYFTKQLQRRLSAELMKAMR